MFRASFKSYGWQRKQSVQSVMTVFPEDRCTTVLLVMNGTILNASMIIVHNLVTARMIMSAHYTSVSLKVEEKSNPRYFFHQLLLSQNILQIEVTFTKAVLA